jgi:hypothetical protein
MLRLTSKCYEARAEGRNSHIWLFLNFAAFNAVDPQTRKRALQRVLLIGILNIAVS